MRKSVMVFLLAFAFLVSGCVNHATEVSPESIVETEEVKPLSLITRFGQEYSESTLYIYHKLKFSVENWMDDETLQKAVSMIPVDYPLSTDDQIQIYARELYKICIEQERFAPEFVPYCARHYLDGVWYVSFLPVTEQGSYYDGPSPLVLISEKDGHIIYLQVE